MINNLGKYASEIGCRVLYNEPMKKHISFKVGGAARLFIEPDSEESLISVMQKARVLNIPYAVIGNGSNLLVEDNGFDGAVIHLGDMFGDIQLIGDDIIFAQAGANLMKVCNFALANGLSGLEFAYGIPGSVGGAAYMNAGAYGGEMKDVVQKCSHIDYDLNKGEYKNHEIGFKYRYSIYNDNKFIITGVYMKLTKGNPDEIKAKMKELYARRIDKQPLEYPSAGSTFKRPEGYFAGKLIEDCGLKGKQIGGAMVSEKHAGFVINYDNASCNDVIALCKYVDNTVFEKFGVHLEKEIKFLSQVKKWS